MTDRPVPPMADIISTVLGVREAADRASDEVREQCVQAAAIAADLINKKPGASADDAISFADKVWDKAWELEDVHGLAVSSALYLAAYVEKQINPDDWDGLVTEIRDYHYTQALMNTVKN